MLTLRHISPIAQVANRLALVIVVLSLLGLMASAWATPYAKPRSMTLCYDEAGSYPWVSKGNKPGLNMILLRTSAQQLGITMTFTPLAWMRCLEQIKSGALDGGFASSFKEDRLEIGNFPMMGAKPDETRALMVQAYALYRLKNRPEFEDAKSLITRGVIGVQPGYSIAEQLKKMGANVSDGSRDAEGNLRQLLLEKFDAVALQTTEVSQLLLANPEFASKIERIKPNLIDKPYFLMLSKQFDGKYPEFAQELWGSIGKVRNSPSYKAHFGAFN